MMPPRGAKPPIPGGLSGGGPGWICIDTLVPNRLVAEALAGGRLPGLPLPSRVRAEVAIPAGSRLDFVLEADGRLLFLEIKSVTWVEDGVALFPDGVTSRGRRHLLHLQELAGQGHQAWNVFVVQREDARLLKPAVAIDPAYARELALAAAASRSWCSRKKSSPRKLPLRLPSPLN